MYRIYDVTALNLSFLQHNIVDGGFEGSEELLERIRTCDYIEFHPLFKLTVKPEYVEDQTDLELEHAFIETKLLTSNFWRSHIGYNHQNLGENILVTTLCEYNLDNLLNGIKDNWRQPETHPCIQPLMDFVDWLDARPDVMTGFRLYTHELWLYFDEVK